MWATRTRAMTVVMSIPVSPVASGPARRTEGHGRSLRHGRRRLPFSGDDMKLCCPILAMIATSSVAFAEPYVPTSADDVLEHVPVRNAELSAERARLAANPQDLDLAVMIARQYVAQGRKE